MAKLFIIVSMAESSRLGSSIDVSHQAFLFEGGADAAIQAVKHHYETKYKRWESDHLYLREYDYGYTLFNSSFSTIYTIYKEGGITQLPCVDCLDEGAEPLRDCNGLEVCIPEKTREHLKAHAEVKESDIREAVATLDCSVPFLITAVDLGRTLGSSGCVEVTEADKVCLFYRKSREGKTPFVLDRSGDTTSKIVICVARDEDGVANLCTAFYGEVAEREPWDRWIENGAEWERCKAFWNTHALVFDPDAIDFERSPEAAQYVAGR